MGANAADRLVKTKRDGFNQESQTHGLHSSGIETILWLRNFASNFQVRRRFVGSEAAFSGTLPRCTLAAFNGAMLCLSISAVQSWMWHPKSGSTRGIEVAVNLHLLG
jgi:hypothetical protein